MTTPTIKRRLDRLDGGGAHGRYDFGNMTDDQLDELIAEQLDAKGILDTAAIGRCPAQNAGTGLMHTKRN